MIADHILRIAAAEVGVEEIDATNCGPRVNEYKAATNLPPTEGWPWCAAFVCWVVREALKAAGVKETATFKRPTTAVAFAFPAWSLEQDDTTSTCKSVSRYRVQPGDIVVYKFSHIGFATSVPDRDGNFYAIEGNTNGRGAREGGAVLRRQRNVSQVRARIRFMI